MTNALTPQSPNAALLEGVTNKDTLVRLRLFVMWLDLNGLRFFKADLSQYKAWLETYTTEKRPKLLNPSSINNYVSTVRRRYAKLARSNTFRDDLYADAPGETFSAQKDFVDELITRIANNADPDQTRVEVTHQQSRPDSEDVRLTYSEALEYSALYGQETLFGLRNTALLSGLFSLGLRIDELCHLTVNDLYKSLDTNSAVWVRKAKGHQQRMVLYAPEFEAFYERVRVYLANTGRKGDTPLFSGFTSQHMNKMQHEPISVRSAQEIVENLPYWINGNPIYLHAHRTRHSYACIMHREFGYDVEYVAYQMGHVLKDGTPNIAMTWRYIGKNTKDPRLSA